MVQTAKPLKGDLFNLSKLCQVFFARLSSFKKKMSSTTKQHRSTKYKLCLLFWSHLIAYDSLILLVTGPLLKWWNKRLFDEMKNDNLWCRKLYIKTNLPDNHVDKSFLKLKKTNRKLKNFLYFS